MILSRPLCPSITEPTPPSIAFLSLFRIHQLPSVSIHSTPFVRYPNSYFRIHLHFCIYLFTLSRFTLPSLFEFFPIQLSFFPVCPPHPLLRIRSANRRKIVKVKLNLLSYTFWRQKQSQGRLPTFRSAPAEEWVTDGWGGRLSWSYGIFHKVIRDRTQSRGVWRIRNVNRVSDFSRITVSESIHYIYGQLVMAEWETDIGCRWRLHLADSERISLPSQRGNAKGEGDHNRMLLFKFPVLRSDLYKNDASPITD